jgi:photosystem II stability/assembly factor-like uncharacterized protein
MKTRILFLLALFSMAILTLQAQKKPAAATGSDLTTELLNGFKFRSIGPAFMSGRISDIAIHPANENIWYVTVGSGNVWKTENAGTTWTPIFEDQGSYSTGCIALDPQRPNIVWLGTGENVGGRHVAYGDGVYRSEDGGKTWKNMGLKESRHISRIIVHPDNSDVVWVASQGPLWSKGGERGVYKTTDAGKTWKKVLGDDAWVGATDLLIDPRNPNTLYAATWQRHRTVAGYMGGGPGTAIHRSYDGGDTWEKLTNGLPQSNMGKIGLAISPQKPDVVYAAIELDRRTGGLYKTENQGSSWKKMSDAVSGGTGPHYYQELYACPHQFDKLYLMDFVLQISEDGGKTFYKMNENNKHIDNHAIAFRMSDPNYLLVGTDGGLYETYDKTTTWKFISNLPVTQFYKVAVDDDVPFYNIYGGTQDNNTQGGPSRTDNVHGIRNSDWFVVLFGDGHQPATEPGNPNIVYAQWQQGNLVRYDRITGEIIYIQPQPEPHEKADRFNWDAPILVSPHNPAHIFFASQRVWKSTDRGDSWEAISGDLTTSQERIRTPFYGSLQSWDNPWDLFAMSNYSTITSLSESPLMEGLIYVGTDDGIIQVTEDGGRYWQLIEFSQLPGLPKTAFVNDIKADLFDVNTVYAVFDNHKFGDLNPYIYKSTDRGRTWQSLVNNLPGRTILWRVVQDHVNPNLLFLGTEFGVYLTLDGGRNWLQMKGGLPVISVRDLAIQKRENDLVLATFGRGFYVLDDYSSLRELSKEILDKESVLFSPRKAWWYKIRQVLDSNPKASQGDDFFIADNPPFGAEFTYYLKEKYTSLQEDRKKTEKEKLGAGQVVAVPAWEALEKEMLELEPKVWLVVTDMSGKLIRKVPAANSKGINRVAWDLTSSSPAVIMAGRLDREPTGPMVAPGMYHAQLHKQIKGEYIPISEKVDVEVRPLRQGHLPAAPAERTAEFWQEVQEMSAAVSAVNITLNDATKKVDMMLKAYERSRQPSPDLHREILSLKERLQSLDQRLNGSLARREVRENEEYATVSRYLMAANYGTTFSTYGPSPSHVRSLENAGKLLGNIRNDLEDIRSRAIPDLVKRLRDIGAPWLEGQELPVL